MSSWSMKAVILTIRAKFSSVNHLTCADVHEMITERGQREPQLLVISPMRTLTGDLIKTACRQMAVDTRHQ